VRRSFNSATVLTDRDVSPHQIYDNVPAPPAQPDSRSEITDFSVFGGQSEIGTEFSPFAGAQSEITDFTNVTFASQPTSSRSLGQSRYNLYPYETSTTTSRRSRASRRTTFSLGSGLVKPVGHFSRTMKDRGRFVWELFKLNYRMLISLTLTLFVAIFVCPHYFVDEDLSQLSSLSKCDI
jgi:hypothetical protein